MASPQGGLVLVDDAPAAAPAPTAPAATQWEAAQEVQLLLALVRAWLLLVGQASGRGWGGGAGEPARSRSTPAAPCTRPRCASCLPCAPPAPRPGRAPTRSTICQVGFALFEAGACRRAASKQIAFKVPLQACVSILAWWALGHAVAMGACHGANCQLGGGGFSGGSDFFLAAHGAGAAGDTSRYAQWMLQVRPPAPRRG
jgi:hypothetical protein